jgi:uncharacterized protein DUF1592/uncharacterized protein DUF1595/uncharacterized protein DUF1588/uncharacterized protein DUF1585/uncharacterized protein DUF1587
VNRTHPLGLAEYFALALAPLLVATAACTVSGAVGDANGGSGSTGPAPNNGTGGSIGAGSGTGVGSAPGLGGQGQGTGTGPLAMSGTPIYTRFVRLTNTQWENSVHDLLKLSEPTGQSQQFLHAVAGTTDFDNNERVVVVNNDTWADFQTAAEAVVAKVTATDQALKAVTTATDAATFIKTFGRRAFRRDLTAAEVTTYTALHQKGSAFTGSQSAFTKGAALVMTTMLQSPHFLYRTELGDNGAPLSGYEMAAKLSLWLWNTSPSDALLEAASKGTLDTVDGAAAQATTMLDAPAATAAMREMHSQLYKIPLLDTITKDNVQGYSEGLKAEFMTAATSFFDFIYSKDLGVKDILTTDVGFAGPLMAALYGTKVTGTGVQQVALSDRTGWYSQAPFLTQWAINDAPDSIHRGVRINLDTLCLEIGPPSTVLPSVPMLQPNQTNRKRVEDLTGACGKPCHTEYINPVGFAFENYDGIGRYRTVDNGQPVDAAGSYPFADGTHSYNGASELMQVIANGPQAHQCWSKKLASYALERDIVEAERPTVEALGAVSQASGGSLKKVMLALVQSQSFRTHVGGAQ